MDFNQANPNPVIIPSSINSYGEANASVCNEQGQLLFYTNGSQVWDRNNNLMPNGNGLINDPLLPPLSGLPSDDYVSSSSQGTIIIPWPEQEGKYYVFSMTAFETGQHIGRLYYSVIDMNLNAGMGDVDPTAKGILVGTGFTEHMRGVVGDRCNVWLLVIDNAQQKLKAYSISSNGIDTNTPVTSSLLPLNYYSKIGQMDVSPDRTKLAIARAGVCLYDFDPATGTAIGKIELLYMANIAYNVCFSAGSSKLYTSYIPFFGQALVCYQFDLDAPDSLAIVNSRYTMPQAVTVYKRAPDGKIYSNGTVNSYAAKGVVHHPDLPGSACQFEMLELAGSCGNNGGFPGFPNVVPVIPHDTFYIQQELSAGCFASNTVITALDDSTGWDYLWNTGDLGASLEVSEPGTYWVSYRTPPCNFHTDTFQVGFPNGVLPMIHVDTACIGVSNGGAYASTYPDDTVHYTYTWLSSTDTLSVTDSLLSVPSGNYTVLIHTAHCDTSLNFSVPVVDYRVNFTLSDTLLCQGGILHFQNTSDTHFDELVWYFGDEDSSMAVTPPEYLYEHPGSYEILLTGRGLICKDTARQSIVVDSFFSTAFQIDQSEICVGDGIIFQLVDADTTFTGLHWDWGDGSYMTAIYENRFYHAFDHPGVWPVRVTLNARVCPDTSFIDTVRVYALPEVNLGGDSILCLDGHAVVLRNYADTPLEIHQYLWNTGDTTADLRVLQPGSYSLRVTTEPLGCNSTDEIIVTKDCYTNIPNAFTPNGDGDNDYFFPRTQLSQSVSNFRMQVFNRWGQLLFETRKVDGRGWDGRFNDKEQPLGVYVYLVDVVYSNGRQERYEGNVTLIR